MSDNIPMSSRFAAEIVILALERIQVQCVEARFDVRFQNQLSELTKLARIEAMKNEFSEGK